jgi:hypothetical protein
MSHPVGVKHKSVLALLIWRQQEQVRQAKAILYVYHAQGYRSTLTNTQVYFAGESA